MSERSTYREDGLQATAFPRKKIGKRYVGFTKEYRRLQKKGKPKLKPTIKRSGLLTATDGFILPIGRVIFERNE